MAYRFRPHHLWTIGGAVAVLNNIVHWNDPPHQTSYIARRHKKLTVLVLLAYSYHFLLEDIHESSYAKRGGVRPSGRASGATPLFGSCAK